MTTDSDLGDARSRPGIGSSLSLIAVAVLTGVGIGWLVGRVMGSDRPSGVAPTPTSTQTPYAGPGPGPGTATSVQISVGSDDVPGCFGPEVSFRAHVNSRWGEMVSQNVLTFRWAEAPDDEGAITVGADGHTLEATVRPGESLPHVTLNLPMGEVMTKARISTFVFTGLDDDGRACFEWDGQPDIPREYRMGPGGLQEARSRREYTRV